MRSRLDDDARALARRNKALGAKMLGGPPVHLDPIQQSSLNLWLRLRRRAGPERGIEVPEDVDPLIARHLEAMDAAFFDDHEKFLRAQAAALEKAAHRRAKPPRPGRE